MGEPAEPTPDERDDRHKVAAAIVESVITDEKMPLPGLVPVAIPNQGLFYKATDVENFVFHQAHEITLLLQERSKGS